MLDSFFTREISPLRPISARTVTQLAYLNFYILLNFQKSAEILFLSLNIKKALPVPHLFTYKIIQKEFLNFFKKEALELFSIFCYN